MKSPLKIDPPAGSHIQGVCEEAVKLAKDQNRVVEFDFNDILVSVAPSDTAEGAVQRFNAECKRRQDEYVKSPAGIEAARRQAEAQRLAHESAAQGIKPFSVREDARADWEKCVSVNSDPYGACTVRYAARWAHLMESKMDAGEKIAAIAEKCSGEADTEGITGFMYGCAVSILAKCWKHGEALRLWHNKTSQLGTEGDKANESGGVLNPAILSVG